MSENVHGNSYAPSEASSGGQDTGWTSVCEVRSANAMSEGPMRWIRYGVAWTCAKVIWTHGTILPTDEEVEAFNHHGLMHGIVATLTDVNTFRASLFTLRDGSLLVHSVSTYCRHIYYHNYWTNNADSTHMYYAGVPSVIQATRHFYIEAALMELFAATKVFGWMSSMNCARVYNYALAQWHAYILNNRHTFNATLSQAFDNKFLWQYTLQMRDTDVLNGFFIYSLLLEKAEHNSCLVLPHDEQGIRQEAYLHACDLCFIVVSDDPKLKIQAAVCDGNTIGHPCCAVHDCKVLLMTNCHCFCPDHQDLNQWCGVDGCDEVHASGSRTCGNVNHQALEDAYFKPTKALFQLRAQLKRAGITLPLDSVPSPSDSGSSSNSTDEDLEAILDLECDGKPENSNKHLRAQFARATFFGSEAVSAVNEFVKVVFPTAASTPEYFVFDNNCKLCAHQDASGDDHFAATGMPVDETDTYCQQHCNPAAFPELISGSKWRFNTSICEQTNIWLGGYQAILRNMSVHWYNFYFDEMIKHWNRYVILELER
ncbi:uncharacterized protein EDB93DRAFT_1238962 [Suillus bovinus]|uniref:uncharacterized protein n=1 Tax=Suillus bovinus TaxID=48563 RepID=UPI001B883F19|nr:uncharacterized protein EDB93DRAFT_1238962 [Suillus bovinus]KAG2156704.1 hypothetical protein EDB93DRAFT_1238962 [Suillus bovinus]